MQLDLDAARASRLAETGESITVTLFGESYVWPPEMPMVSLVEPLREGETFELYLARICLGQDGIDRLLASRSAEGQPASNQDLLGMVDAVLGAWGLSLGESAASEPGSTPEAGETSSSTSSPSVSTPAAAGDSASVA
jgi:hypothetical protein